jgi:hypothetical protein
MLFSKLGSYPKPETDGTEGWIEVPDAPEVPEGKQLAWLNGEWVVRDPKPADRDGYQWNWAHDSLSWIECEYPATAPPTEMPSEPVAPTEPTVSSSISNGFSATL